MFEDRKDAGKKLARALEKYREKYVLVLAIPNGGVQVGYEVSTHLNADLSILVAKKLPFPDNPEAGFGAVAEDGSTVILKEFTHYLSEVIIKEIIQDQEEEIARRIKVLRRNESLPELKGRTVILIDDGIAMGSTMQAAIKLCKKQKPSWIVVATPVAAREVRRRLSWIVDDIVVLEEPYNFRAVAQVYSNWYDVPDWEVLEILDAWKKQREKE
jgi:predicted phosphoribosyltransferase